MDKHLVISGFLGKLWLSIWNLWKGCDSFFFFPPCMLTTICHFLSKFSDLWRVCCKYMITKAATLYWFMPHLICFCPLNQSAAAIIKLCSAEFSLHKNLKNISLEYNFVFKISALAVQKTFVKGTVIEGQTHLFYTTTYRLFFLKALLDLWICIMSVI